MYYENTFPIRAGDADAHLHCRPSGMLDMLQEAATQAAIEFHASGPEMQKKYGALWMVTRIWYRLERPLLWNEMLTIRTWHRGDKGVAMYRDFDLYVDGVQVGEAVSIWALVDAERRKPMRLSAIRELDATSGGALCKDKKLTGIHMPPEMTLAERRRFHYSDIDCNGHVNNVRYADLAADAAHLERREKGMFVSRLQIGFRKECLAGESIDVLTAETEDGIFVRGADQEGEPRFDAQLILDNLPGLA